MSVAEKSDLRVGRHVEQFIGRWYVDDSGFIHAGDENGKFPYCIFTRTLQDIGLDDLSIRIRFKLLIYSELPKPVHSERISYVRDARGCMILLRGDNEVPCVKVLGVSKDEKGRDFSITCEMVATFGGIITKIA